jgi:hypothetical protein
MTDKGNTVALSLSIAALVMSFSPIICLALAIPALVMANGSARRESLEFQSVQIRTRSARILSVIAISLTVLFMVLAIPGAYVANFG